MTNIDHGPAAQRLAHLVAGVADDAPHLDRVIALSGRNPAWRP